jgi:hypothetical protein
MNEATTRDHIHLGTPHPAETGLPTRDHEHRLHRYSRRALTAGISIHIGVYLATLTVALLANGGTGPFGHPNARLYAILGALSLMTLGTALIITSAIERLLRPTRTLMRQTAVRSQETATAVVDLADTIERLRVISHAGIYEVTRARHDIARLDGHLSTIEATIKDLPDYSAIIQDGYRLGRHSAGLGDLDQLGINPTSGPNGWPSAAG